MLKTNKIIIIRICFSIVIILTLCFIYSNSLKTQHESSEQSSEVFETIKPIVDPIIKPINGTGLTHHLVRKAAHFSEFALLGLEVALLLVLTRVKIWGYIIALPFGFIAASADEIIQKFSERGNSFVDVIIDFSGFCTAFSLTIAVFCIIIHIISVKNRKREEKTKKS